MALELTILPYAFAKQHGVIVRANATQENISIYHVPPINWYIIAESQRFLRMQGLHGNLILTEINAVEFQKHLAVCYQSQINLLETTMNMEEDLDLTHFAEQLPRNEDLLDPQNEAPIIRLINALFTQAIKQQASDIHIETYENNILVRNRIDGVLHSMVEIQRAAAPLVISRIKVMAKLDIADKRLPQY